MYYALICSFITFMIVYNICSYFGMNRKQSYQTIPSSYGIIVLCTIFGASLGLGIDIGTYIRQN